MIKVRNLTLALLIVLECLSMNIYARELELISEKET